MVRQIIKINDYEYIAELFDADLDYTPVIYKDYVIIRNVSFIDNIACDTDIYFLDKDIYLSLLNDETFLKQGITESVVFPLYNSNFGSFTKKLSDLNDIFDNADRFRPIYEGGEIFELYKFDVEKQKLTNDNVKIKCDKVRIYHPHNKVDLNYIIYLDNKINGIHFHYFCNLNKNCQNHAETSFTHNYKEYSEYIEFYIPNIQELFNNYDILVDETGRIIQDNNYYFNDFYNSCRFSKNASQMKSDERSDNQFEYVSLYVNEIPTIIPFHLITFPFITFTDKTTQTDYKLYYKYQSEVTNNHNSYPINITIYPYSSKIMENNYIYLTHEKYVRNSDVFVKNNSLDMRTYIGFKYNNLSLNTEFLYTNRYDEYTNPTGLTIQEKYAEYNGLSKPVHCGFNKLTNATEIYNPANETNYQKVFYAPLEYVGWERVVNEWTEEVEEIKMCGYKIEISSDETFNNLIYSTFVETPYIDDLSFSLVGLFDNWFTLPKNVLLRVKFIDNVLGLNIPSHIIILNKEILKYTINNLGVPRLYSSFINKQTEINKMAWNTFDANANNCYFNFIDKINCSIINNEQSLGGNMGKNNNLKILYKPIFYKVQDLHSIKILTGMKQNIGINLSNYMTKVNIFKLSIDGVEFSETGRNDVYVIFNIDANLVSGAGGTYHISDNTDQYISSGAWSKV